MFINNINPEIISLGPLSIRFYGLVYALGFLFVTYILSKKAEQGKIKNLDKDKAVDLISIAMIAGLIGARIFHVITDYPLYVNNFWGMFKIWEGGLGFQGGLIGAVIAGYFYCKKYKIKMFKVSDIALVYLPLVIGFGRIANFTNSEFYGSITNVPWCVVFQKIDNLCRHPAQLYQALTQFILFGVLFFLSKKKFSKKTGNLTWSFILGYGIIRFATDFIRINHSMYFFGISHTQILSLVMIGLGSYMLIKLNKKHAKHD